MAVVPVIYKNISIKKSFNEYKVKPELIINDKIIKRVESVSTTDAACVLDRKSLNLKRPIVPISNVMQPVNIKKVDRIFI